MLQFNTQTEEVHRLQADNVSLQQKLDSVAADVETEQADKVKVGLCHIICMLFSVHMHAPVSNHQGHFTEENLCSMQAHTAILHLSVLHLSVLVGVLILWIGNTLSILHQHV